jgi:hypothetical protein
MKDCVMDLCAGGGFSRRSSIVSSNFSSSSSLNASSLVLGFSLGFCRIVYSISRLSGMIVGLKPLHEEDEVLQLQ